MLCEKSLNLFKEDFDNDQIIVTANRRLANYYLQEYDERQKLIGKKAWRRPTILPLTEWIQSLWHSIHSKLRLLNPFQELQIWKSIVQNSGLSLINVVNTAKLAQSAWQTLHLWEVAPETLEHNNNEEVSTFLGWVKLFKNQCHDYEAITYPELPKKLISSVSDYSSLLPKKIHLCGFEEIAPIYQRLFSSFEAFCSHEIHHFTHPVLSTHRIGLTNELKEIETMARWAKDKIEKFPDHNIGCIIPELHRLRPQVNAIFTEIFHPEKTITGNSNLASLFNISVGQSLKQYDLIQSAISVLELMTGKLNLQQSYRFFQSPYFIQNEMDKSVGALLDLDLRHHLENELPLYAVFKPLEKLVKHFSKTTWLRRMQSLISLQKNFPKKAYASEWADHFIAVLQVSGWPGSRVLNSDEYQLMKRCEKLILEFASLDFLQVMSFSQALVTFKQLITDTIFQPQTHKTPIQILGVLEAIGLSFDELWIMGLHDGIWPSQPKPNPFIPYSLQTQHRMPHANANRELEYTKQLTSHLLASANTVMVSYPLQKEDRELRSSHLITALKEITEEELNLKPYESYLNQIYHSSKKESIKDDIAPPIHTDEYLWGGSGVIRDQSACPFRAFANYRLNAKPLEAPFFGLSPSTRGILLHKILEKIWREIKDYHTLMTLENDTLLSKIKNNIQNVINDFSENNLFFSSQKILDIEKKRLVFLISRWFEIEKQRSPFTVLQREIKYKININHLPLSIQIDRIDQCSDGSHIIIDYKTSNSSISDWFGDRPREPQLPLYCTMTNPENLNYAGISFAVIRTNKMEFKGIMQEYKNQSIKFPGVLSINELKKITQQKSWNEIKNNWLIAINELADEFSKGIAKVNPQDKKTCEYCHLHSLCRINEK